MYVIARYTWCLIKEAHKCELSRFFFKEWKISHWERGACRLNVDGKIVVFLSSVVYYFGDLLISANMTFVRHKTFIVYDLFTAHFKRFLSHMLRAGWHTSSLYNNFGFCRSEILSSRLWGNINNSFKFKNCATIPEIILK